jgi:hypothetical protein
MGTEIPITDSLRNYGYLNTSYGSIIEQYKHWTHEYQDGCIIPLRNMVINNFCSRFFKESYQVISIELLKDPKWAEKNLA